MLYPEGDSHSNRNIAKADAWIETRATSIQEEKSKGSGET